MTPRGFEMSTPDDSVVVSAAAALGFIAASGLLILKTWPRPAGRVVESEAAPGLILPRPSSSLLSLSS